MNYDADTTTRMIILYTKAVAEGKERDCVKRLAEELGRSEKSIIGKLAKEGVYKKQVYVNKLGEFPETKKEIIAKLAGTLGLDPERIQGLEKAPKLELKLLLSAIK